MGNLQVIENFLLLRDPWLMLILYFWVLPWKGWALWRASRQKQIWWFVILLVVNTLGFLEIFYIFVVSNPRFSIPVRKKLSKLTQKQNKVIDSRP